MRSLVSGGFKTKLAYTVPWTQLVSHTAVNGKDASSNLAGTAN